MTLTWVKFNFCPCRCKTFTYFIFRLTITFKWLRVDELRYPEQLALAALIFLISFSSILLLYLVCKVFQERVLLFYIVATDLKILWKIFWQHHFVLGSFLVSLDPSLITSSGSLSGYSRLLAFTRRKHFPNRKSSST